MRSLWFRLVLTVSAAALVVQGVTLSAAAQPTALAAGEDGAASPEGRSGPDRADDGADAAGLGTVSTADAEARMAASSIGSTTVGIGDRRFYRFDEHALTDRMSARVNVANGNLLVSATDVSVAGTGIDAGVRRFFNSLTTEADGAGFGPGWSSGETPTVRLGFPTSSRVTFVGPGGYRVRFDKDTSGAFVRAEPGIDATLTLSGGQYRLLWHSKQLQVFDSAGRLLRSEDKQGNQLTYAYDGSGRLDTITDTQGRVIEYSYDPASGLVDQVTDVAGGRVFDYDYATFAGDPTLRLASFEVAAYGLGSNTVNVGADTTFDYDAEGRLTSIVDPLGRTTQIGYVSGTRQVATLTRVTDSSSEPDPTTSYSYGIDPGVAGCEGAGVVAATRLDGPRTDVADTTTFCVDGHDRVVDVIDAAGHHRASSYAANSNVAEFNDSETGTGLPFVNTWDANDNLREFQLPTSGKTTAEYTDPANPHFPTEVRNFASSPTTVNPNWGYTYDANGYLIEAKNVRLNPDAVFRYCYNAKGLLQRIDLPPFQNTNPDTSLTAGCGYGNQGGDTLFYYDSAGNLTQVDPPGAHRTQTFTYDALSRITTMTDGRGVVATYSYDAMDRITSVDYAQPAGGNLPGAASIDYTWDAAGNQRRVDQAGNDTSSHYDELNRLVETSTATPYWETEYSYDTAGNLVGLDGADEPDVFYSYDKLNRVASVTDQKGRTTSFGYDNRGNRTTTAYPNGVTMATAYDDSSRISCIYGYTGTAPTTGTDGCPNPSTSLLTFFGYDYAAHGNGNDTMGRRKMVDRLGHTTEYGYDSLERLRRAQTFDTGGTETRDHQYLLDLWGNITRETVTGNAVANTVTTLAYNDANELCWTATGDHTPDCGSAPSGATGYGYDDAGNLTTTTDGMSAGYTLAGQTAQVTPPGGAAFAMAYVGATSDDRRQAGDLQMSTTALGLAAQGPASTGQHSDWFLRDPHGTLLAMINRDDDAKDLYYLLDGLGSIAATTDENGAVVNRYSYEPYGQQTSPSPDAVDAGGDPLDRNPWRFASGYYDTETGLLKYGTRYYSPSLMRWTQPDPIMGQLNDPTTLNLYTYAGCNPVNYIDTTGRQPCEFLAATAAATGAAGVALGAAALFGGPAAPVFGAAGVASGVASLVAGAEYALLC